MVMRICATVSVALRMHAVSCEIRAGSANELCEGIYPSAIAQCLRPMRSIPRLPRYAALLGEENVDNRDWFHDGNFFRERPLVQTLRPWLRRAAALDQSSYGTTIPATEQSDARPDCRARYCQFSARRRRPRAAARRRQRCGAQ